MHSITIKNLEAIVSELNTATGSPDKPWTRDPQDKIKANIGNFHLSQSYGGWCVHRIHNPGGGATTPIWQGHIPKREAYNLTRAFLNGLRFKEREQNQKRFNGGN